MLYIDITELASNPLRTGIQRVTREILRDWPVSTPMTACVYDAGNDAMIGLPNTVLAILREEQDELRAMEPKELASLVARARAGSGARRVDPPDGALFTPELFYDPQRCAYYLRRLQRDPTSVRLLIYDFIPWLHPETLRVGDASRLMWYLRVVQAARNVAFISAATRDDWAQRIVRQPALHGPIIPLGSDGVVVERQTFRPDRRAFLAVGSLDGRRNQDRVVAAFEPLWAQGVDAPLEFFGHIFDMDNAVARAVISAAKRYPQIKLHASATDADLAYGFRRARATIFASSAEGYGLPPMESLHAGVPTVVTASVPSIQMLPARGHIRMEEPSVEEIRASVVTLLDDAAARRIWGEAEALPLPRWADMTAALHAWLGVR